MYSIAILVGGRGERVKKITNGSSKSEIYLSKNKKIVDFQLEKLLKIKKKIYFISNIEFYQLKKYVLTKYKKNRIKFLEEKKRYGTGGSLNLLKKFNEEYYILIFGDLLFNLNFKKLMKFHISKKSDCTIVVHPNSHPYDSDCVKLDEFQRVIKFYKKPHKKKISNLCLSGIILINKNILKLIKNNKFQDFSKNIIPKILKKKNFFGYNSREYIKDVGTSKRIIEAKKDLNSIKYLNGIIDKKIPAIFLDRDGVINYDQDDGKYQDPTKIIPGVQNAIKNINTNGYLCILVTNQPAVAKGFIKISKLKNDFDFLQNKLGKNGAYIDRIYFCPHHPKKGFRGEIKSLKFNCNCRKPKNGMFIKAIKELNIDISKSYMIGDKYSDYLAAKKSKIKFIYIGKEKNNLLNKKNLYSAVNYIFKKKSS